MKKTALLSIVWLLAATGAWAQPGGGPGRGPDAGGERSRPGGAEPHGPRQDLRALIRQQPVAPLPQDLQETPRHQRQLTPEERMALREQLRQQRGENWRRSP